MITVTINTTRGGTVSAPFAALATERITFLGDLIPGDNTTLALLDEHGGTLAQGRIVGAEADLDLNTCQADEATRYATPGEPIRAYLAVGDTDNLLAVIPCQLVRNALDNLAPPAELAPTYPTSERLLAILTEMTEQANRAEEAVEATGAAQKAVAKYVDEVFPAKVEQAERTLAKSVTDGTSAVTQKANQAIGAISSHASNIETSLDQKQTQIEASIDGKAKSVNTALENKVTEVNSALDTKITSATTAIDGKVTEANNAKTDAVKAKGEAEGFKGQAEGFATQASTSASNASTSATKAKTSEDNAKASANALMPLMEKAPLIDYNNECAKITEYPSFVQTVCKACGITGTNATNGFLPLGLIYTMANGWTIVSLVVPNTTSYFCVFDAGWNLLYKLVRSGDVRLTYIRVCEEVDGVAYVFVNSTHYLTVAEAEDGTIAVSEIMPIDFGELGITSISGIGVEGFRRIHSNVLGKYIFIGDIAFDTTNGKAVVKLDKPLEYPWKGTYSNQFCANIGGYFTKFSLDADGNIVVTKLSTSEVLNSLLVNAQGINASSSVGWQVTNVSFNMNRIISSSTLNQDGVYGITYVSPTVGVTLGSNNTTYSMGTPFYHLGSKTIVAIRTDGCVISFSPALLASYFQQTIAIERVLMPTSAYNLKGVLNASYNSVTRILGVDSKGIWMTMGRTNGWVTYHTIGGKVFRVLWEDLK